jgi:1,4-alpha-glucan branching enzyme
MLDNAQIAALLAARHSDPFALLGPHRGADGALYIRVLLPSATTIAIVDSKAKLLANMQKRHVDGFFEARLDIDRESALGALDDVPNYRLQVQFANGTQVQLADAYAIGPQLAHDALIAFREGSLLRVNELLGAHPHTVADLAGVRFALWAPNASRVSVVGSFNDWDGRRHPMRLRHDAGVWEIFIPQVAIGDLYKFELLDRHGHLLPLKADPYARFAQLRPDNASRVAAMPARVTLPEARQAANARQAPISIYEVHASSWCTSHNGGVPDWDELAERLPLYAAELGFSHIELMPISEFPFDGSWGYQTLGLFAPSARFGAPEGFARFVAACHARGVGVLLDWVPAHFPSDAHGLAQFDGTALYEYGDAREGFHKDWNTLIYNYSRTEVRSFLIASALYWLERYGVDGLRVDAVASMLYRDYSRNAGEWLPNHLGGRENLEAISLFRAINEQLGALPGAISIAEESTAFPGVSAPTYAGGLGFHFKWNMGWMNDTLRYMAEHTVHRRWHHDKLSFGLVYAFSENYVLPISHDEVVHGKGSMLSKMPGDLWQRFANLRAYYGFMWGHPGKKLLFMGQEFAQVEEWQHEQALPWHLLQEPAHLGVQRLIKDLNALYRNQPALHQLDCAAQGFQWLVLHDSENSVYAWARFDSAGQVILVVCNFTPVVRSHYRLPLPDGFGAFKEVLNTDSAHYGGSNVGNGAAFLQAENIAVHGRNQSMLVTLPPLATLFFAPL